jgi:hypothetical protein
MKSPNEKHMFLFDCNRRNAGVMREIEVKLIEKEWCCCTIDSFERQGVNYRIAQVRVKWMFVCLYSGSLLLK